ncbi:AraC family transcriptional regulator [Pseudomonas sp. gcc21]|uniref:AraC family transcriptional regulator n=1 Tax=Pseudomonas sp. gcc21 TaxID=2726989 RepID=UPI0021147ED8|nr:AraC family transcriptional regulator [Pseudomonas sp. gcc21]
MLTVERTTSSSWAHAIVDALALSGMDGRGLLAELGLDSALLDDPDARIPQDQMTRLWQLAVSRSGDPAIGLNMARIVRPAHFNVVGYALMSSSTLGEAFGRLVRYQRILGEAAALDLQIRPDSYALVVSIHGDRLPVSRQSHDAALAYALAFCRWMTGRDIVPLKACFAYPEPADVSAYQQVFACPLVFDAGVYSLSFSRDVIEQPLATANLELARIHDRLATEYLARFDDSRISHLARQALCRLLPQGEPKRQAVASALHMSTRTLQRRLQEEGNSFQQLLDETRRELSQQYLVQPNLTLLEIAYLLGFADPSNFFRAFKRWFGMPPGQYRARQLEEDEL